MFKSYILNTGQQCYKISNQTKTECGENNLLFIKQTKARKHSLGCGNNWLTTWEGVC